MTVTQTSKSRNSQEKADGPGGPLDLATRYNCDNCNKDITDVVRITCATCEEVDLCVTCFAKGVQPGTRPEHRNDHPYRVVEVLDFPVFDPLWAADEELLFIENMEHYGLGNWEQVSEQLSTKTKEECMKHYEEVYIDSPSWPMPNMSIEFDKESNRRRLRMQAMESTMSPASKKTAAQSIKPPRPYASNPQVHEIQGYMPGRGEYDIEPENSAEDPVKDITFDAEDGPAAVSGLPMDEELKVALLDVYNSKLDIREDKKRFVKEVGLLEYRKVTNAERKRKAEERAIYEKSRVFARCITKADFEELMKAFCEELDLRQQIAQLQEWRRMGVRTAEEGKQYESEKLKRVNNLRLLGFNVGPVNNQSATAAAVVGMMEREKKPAIVGSGMNLTPVAPSSVPVNIPPILAPTAPPSTLNLYRFNRPAPSQLDISKADGVDLLSPAEQILCATLRILPQPYLVIKEKCIQESARMGGIKKQQARELIKID
ncbi:hypothetical protein M427DRAFT_73307, partial [Gonapodya prolifera JEL478]